jgi:hypothetical protein
VLPGASAGPLRPVAQGGRSGSGRLVATADGASRAAIAVAR